MENSWQVKCCSTLQSSTPPLTSSSSQELRNQTVINAGYYFYPHGQEDIRTAVHERLQDPSLPNNSLISSHRLGNANPANSFLSLLSGPPPLLQSEFQELSNPKPFCSSGKLMSDNSSVLVNAIGSRIPLRFSGLPSENLSKQNLHGAGFCPIISSRLVTSSNCTSSSVLPDLKISELDKAVVHCMVPGNEKVKGSFSLSGDWHSTGHANIQKACGTRVQTFQVKSIEANSNQSSSFMSGCPRVFCLGTGGYLLLSNTGLLGIVCSCHCFHMSVLKFCEHSGLFGVNPGDAVRVDNGETIAQWRKVYFQKFGIRVPEDQSDWDWPEGLSTTAGLLNSRAATPNIFSNISHLVHPSEGLVRSGQILDNTGLSKNHHADQNLVIDALQNKQKRNFQDNSNILLKGLIGTSKSNVRAVADNQIMECSMSQCSTMSKFVGIGSQDGSQSISGYIDSILKNGNASISYPALQELKTVCKESDFSTINAQSSLYVGRDAAISNIELKLGQPYQSSQNSENSDLSALGPQLLDTLVNPPPKSVFPEQIMHNNDLREKVELEQYLYFATGPSGPSTKREPGHLDPGSCAFEVGNTLDAGRLEKLRGNLVHNSVVSLPIHSKIPPESSTRTKANENTLIGMEHTVPNTQYSCSFAWHNENGLERQLHIPELGSRGLTDKGKGVGSIGDNYYFMKDSGFRIHKEMEITGSARHFPVQFGNSCYLHQLSSLAVEVPDARKICNYPENVPFHGTGGQVDHVNHRSLAVHMGSGLISPSQAVSKGIPSATSTCLLDQTSALSRDEGIGVSGHLLDDNLRLLALRQMLDISKQQNAFSSLGMNKGEGKYGGLSYTQHSFSEPSVPGEQWHGSGLTSKMDVSESAVEARLSGAICRFGGDKGMTHCCDFSTMTQGISLHPKEMAVHCQLSNDHLRKEQPSMRSDKNIAGSSGRENSCCRVPSNCFQQNCNCSVHSNYFERNFESRVGNFPNVLNEQIGMVNGEASVIFGSKFAKNHSVPNDKMISLEQRKLNAKFHKNIFSHSSQWRDVPSKVKGVFDVMRVDCSSDVIDGKGDLSQHRETSSKCFNDTMQVVDSLKENEISNISSGCSSPAVTQVSVEVNNTDSYSADAANSGYASHLVIDEESGIDKCWSSDDARGSERSADFHGATFKISSKEPGSSKNIYHQSSRSLLDELKLINSLTWKKGQNQIQTGIASQNKNNLSQKFERGLKAGKRKRDCSSPLHYENSKHTGNAELPSSSSKSNQIISSSSQGKTHGASFSQQSSERKFSAARKLPHKSDIHKLYNDREEKDVSCEELSVAADTNDIYELSGGKNFQMDYTCAVTQARKQDPTHEGIGVMKYNSVGCVKSSSLQVNTCQWKPRPVVCGKYGELSDGKQVGAVSKSAKIVPLSNVLKSAKRCKLPQNQEPKPTFVRELKKTGHDGTDVYCDELCYLKTETEGCSHKVLDYGSINNNTAESMKKGCSYGDNKYAEEMPMLEKEKHDKSKNDCRTVDTVGCQSKIKSKEVRKRSIYELTVDGKDPCCKRFSFLKTSKCFLKRKAGKISRKDEDKKLGFCGVVAQKSPQVQSCSSFLNSDAFCCVCGSSNKDELNCLLDCSQCSIKVHQACYGVSRVPKGHWYCRPCRTNSKDIVCVLCGYGGGAMTRALRSCAIAKTFLRAWDIETKCRPKTSSVKTLQNELSRLHSSRSGHEEGTSFCMFRPENIEPLASAACKMEMPYHLDVEQNSTVVNKLKVHNSVTVGLLDSKTKQWVHMVCALWTPGTRCPNVDTMSAFDVSGASRPKTDVLCSICCRPGGSCIQCRVINCSIQFHPWCAHQKGLLQSEIEGVDNESVGFYGRCMLHAHPMCETDCDPADIETGRSGIEEFTCARTEGYKGRKRDGFCHKYGHSNGKSGCLVPQEQFNAWIHINGQKTCTQGLPKLPASDVEHDWRKEYARYKQVKGWKHLVVYKSGIHALGLYTSRFISHGEMVVEYVGEIVGQRVADKRENEYQSGRKLQYKSACYFFRIDKEHIIDATHKGGIARFVNHSCLPNCVAKVISVRNEKKVVFFAERDIFPGEEITYDYHFNHEDEGKKIPCFCNSKNCRRYLN